MTTKHTIPPEMKGARLDAIVKQLFEVSWSRARAWITGGKISIDGAVVSALDANPSPGETIVYTEDARRIDRGETLDDRSILHADRHVIVATKPAGILTSPFEGTEDAFDKQLRSYLARTAPKQKKRRGALPSLMVVHRLDRGTSGLLVFARTRLAMEELAEQFKEHTAERRYVALVHGEVTSQTITTHLLDDRGDGIRGSREHSRNPKTRRSGRGRRAVTHVKLVEAKGGVSRIHCRLETGRTNQVRIHLSELGHPLLGETTYMRGFKGLKIPAPRLMLHAELLGFVHPATGEPMSFEQPPPNDFKHNK